MKICAVGAKLFHADARTDRDGEFLQTSLKMNKSDSGNSYAYYNRKV